MEKEQQQWFIKKTNKISERFDTCVFLATNDDDDQLVSAISGSKKEIATAIARLLQTYPDIYEQVMLDTITRFKSMEGADDDE